MTDSEGNYLFDPAQGGKEPEIYLYDLANVVLNSNDDRELQIQVHLLKEGEDIPANKPFIIKPQDDIQEDIYFYNVTIANPTVVEPSVDDVQFWSLFIKSNVKPEANHKIIEIDANGELQEHTENVNLNGLNGYFIVSSSLPAYDYAVIQLSNGTSTDVIRVEQANKPIKMIIDNRVYILQGENVYSILGEKQ